MVGGLLDRRLWTFKAFDRSDGFIERQTGKTGGYLFDFRWRVRTARPHTQ